MRFNRNKDISPKYLLLLLSIVCIALIVVSTIDPNLLRPVRQYTGKVITPLQQGVDEVGGWISDHLKMFGNIKQLQEENEELKKQVDIYRTEIERNQAELAELNELRSLYNLSLLYPDYNMTIARVFSTNSSECFNEFYINKGLNDGIYEDCNVLCDAGLVGIVTEAYDDYSKVRAIIDDDSTIVAEIGNENVLCTVEGDISTLSEGYILVKDIDKNALISEGDKVITSNVSDRYFYGITIGYITDITMDTNNLTKSAHLIPAADFSDIDDLQVILDRKKEVNY